MLEELNQESRGISVLHPAAHTS